ncbi:ATP-binding protein [Lachnospiraceae bacterium 47-T17]
MKKKINRRLAASIVVAFFIYILLSQFAQIFIAQGKMVRDSAYTAEQIARIMESAQLPNTRDTGPWEAAFSLINAEHGTVILAIDPETTRVLGAAGKNLAGKTAEELDMPEGAYRKMGHGFHATIENISYYGVCYDFNGIVYGRLIDMKKMYGAQGVAVILNLLFAVLALAVLGWSFSKYLDRNLIRPLIQVNRDLEKIAGGDLKAFVNAHTMPELSVLSDQINRVKENTFALQLQEKKQQQLLAVEAERADAANAAKRVFLSRMSHNIRTPMNGIIGMTAIAEAHIDEKDRVLDALGKIDDSSKQLLSLINEVLDMSMMEFGQMTLLEEEFQLSSLVDETIEELRPFVETREHQLVVETNNLVHDYVVGAPGRVREIFTNIIDNAVKYTPRGGRIRVTISELPADIRYAGKYLFVFEDNGIGMEPEVAARIFEPFEGAKNDQYSGEIQGTGLGLSIVKSIVQLMNGSIEVESVPEEGSRFSVTISLKLQKREAGEEVSAEKYEVRLEDFREEDYSDKRVLLVEDNELNREIATEILGMTGITIEEAFDGQQAVLRMTEVPEGYFDLILMDIQMPVMDGYIATRMIRNMQRTDTKKLPIIAMTANAFPEDVEAAKASGMDEHIAKPLELDRLKEVLMKWL